MHVSGSRSGQGERSRSRSVRGGRPLGQVAIWTLLAVVLVAAVKLTGIGERMAYLPARGTPAPPPGVEDVTFETEDGLTLHGWFLPATGQADGPRPAILVTHGNAGNVSSHLPFVEFLPEAGFHVLLFDYRGYGKSDRGRLQRDALLVDTRAALDALAVREDVDASRIGLYAQSIGAVFGLHVMADDPRVRAAAVLSSFTRWRDVAASVLGGSNPGPVSRALAWAVMPAGLEPLDALSGITDRPVLLVHGRADEIVPFEHGERLAEAGGDNVTFVAVEQGGHNDLRWVDPALDATLVDFYRRHLLP